MDADAEVRRQRARVAILTRHTAGENDADEATRARRVSELDGARRALRAAVARQSAARTAELFRLLAEGGAA